MLQLQIIGNLTKDAETRVIGTATYTAFTAAVNVNKETTAFINVRKRIGDNGGILAQYLTKGKKVFVQGQMSVQTYTNNQGQVTPDITLWADRLELLSSKQEGGQNTDPFDK